MANTTVAVTPGSGALIAAFNDASASPVSFQRVINAQEPSQKNTFYAAYKALSAGTAATTNLITFAGSATKKVTLTRMVIAATASTAAAGFDVLVNRQSTADTGGTASTTATVIKADVTLTGTVSAVAPLFYTAGPTAGTVTGLIAAYKLFAPITATAAPVTSINVIPDLNVYGQGIVLNGVADVIAVTLNAVTPANATSFDVSVSWTEEG